MSVVFLKNTFVTENREKDKHYFLLYSVFHLIICLFSQKINFYCLPSYKNNLFLNKMEKKKLGKNWYKLSEIGQKANLIHQLVLENNTSGVLVRHLNCHH